MSKVKTWSFCNLFKTSQVVEATGWESFLFSIKTLFACMLISFCTILQIPETIFHINFPIFFYGFTLWSASFKLSINKATVLNRADKGSSCLATEITEQILNSYSDRSFLPLLSGESILSIHPLCACPSHWEQSQS